MAKSATGLVQDSRNGQPEGRDRGIELEPVVGHHLVASLHSANRSLDDGAARVAESLARLEIGLLAHDPVAAGLLHVAVCIRDDPMTREQSGGDLAFVA